MIHDEVLDVVSPFCTPNRRALLRGKGCHYMLKNPTPKRDNPKTIGTKVVPFWDYLIEF